MKKLIYIVIFLSTLIGVSQNPAELENGAVIGSKSSDGNDAPGIKEGQLDWNSFHDKFRYFDGVNWNDFGTNITLTTNGDSGPSTLINGVLNVPNYNLSFFSTSRQEHFTAIGGETTWVLNHTPNTAFFTDLFVTGVLQLNGVDYSLSGNTITFLNHNNPLQSGDLVQIRYNSITSVPVNNLGDWEIVETGIVLQFIYQGVVKFEMNPSGVMEGGDFKLGLE